jgi:hypothetical protein
MKSLNQIQYEKNNLKGLIVISILQEIFHNTQRIVIEPSIYAAHESTFLPKYFF